jgi:ubiquinone/menaquinone biosynthesis C-methylase UbiE
MLTWHDFTVKDAADVFEQCKDSQARYWGFKEHPLPLGQMRDLYARMKACGKTTVLEVVSYSEAEGLAGAQVAADCGCDILMGTVFTDAINEFCKAHQLRYMPFVGTVTGRPSVLEGRIEDMVREARRYLEKGVYGIDLLAYRYTGDVSELIRTFVREVQAPVCLAGSIDSHQRLDEVKQASPWAFTIGSAFFENKFGQTFAEQINHVCHYMKVSDEVVSYYDTIAQDYDESRFNNSYGRFIDMQERRILDQLIDTSKKTLRLEVACGTGRLTNYATHGLDASSEMMRLARERHPEVEFRQASATETGFPDEMFDIVYSFHLLMHLDEDTIRQIFQEVYRILKPGGRFIFDIPSKKRRHLLHHRQASWHGGTALSTDDVRQLASEAFCVHRHYGVMLLPVHQLPVRLRKPLQRTDYAMANGWLREYSSYLVFELQKQ